MAVVELTEEDGWFRRDSQGREVIQWRVSRQFPVKVGDSVLCEGRTVEVAAVGSEFKSSTGKYCYLYAQIPMKMVPRLVEVDSVDEDVAQHVASAKSLSLAEESKN